MSANFHEHGSIRVNQIESQSDKLLGRDEYVWSWAMPTEQTRVPMDRGEYGSSDRTMAVAHLLNFIFTDFH
jgi:hypothetical protein